MSYRKEIIQIRVTQTEKEKLKEKAKKEEKSVSEYVRKKLKL